MAGNRTAPVVRDSEDPYQRDNRTIVKRLAEDPINTGVTVKNVSVGTTAKTITHSLGRTPVGFFVVDREADVRVFRTPGTKATTTTISLTASGSATVTIRVF